MVESLDEYRQSTLDNQAAASGFRGDFEWGGRLYQAHAPKEQPAPDHFDYEADQY